MRKVKTLVNFNKLLNGLIKGVYKTYLIYYKVMFTKVILLHC